MTAIRGAVEEEIVSLRRLEPVVHACSMPAFASERLWLYLAPYGAADRIGPGGGLHEAGELITTAEVPLAVLSEAAQSGRLLDLRTLVLVQALMPRRPELFV